MSRYRTNQSEQVSRLFSFVAGKKVYLPNDLWLLPKLCHCKRWGYPDWKAFALAEGKMKEPPRCTKCDKYQNQMQICPVCHEWFYLWFRHSRQGFHNTPRKGFYCWNCCERYYPPVVEPNALSRFGFRPPPPEILPPGYELYLRERRKHLGTPSNPE